MRIVCSGRHMTVVRDLGTEIPTTVLIKISKANKGGILAIKPIIVRRRLNQARVSFIFTPQRLRHSYRHVQDHVTSKLTN
jgi:hypothetical protein